MVSKYLYILLLVIGVFTSNNVIGNQFSSDLLYRLAQELGKDNPSVLPVYIFFENYVNELLPLTPKEQKKRLEEELASIENGELTNLQMIQDTSSLSISNKNMRYRVCVKNGTFVLIEMSFPMSFELIFGLNKLEMEVAFINQLQSININDTGEDDIKYSELEKTAVPKFFIKRGRSYYIPSLISDLYYKEVDNKLELIVSSDHLVESFANIMMSEHTLGDYSLQLDIRKYGFKKETISIPIKRWLAYCKTSGCDCYFGVEEVDGEELEATIFIVNEDFKYNHILNISVNSQILDDKKGVIKGSVNIYIPTHNILDLLERYSTHNNEG